MTPSTVSLIGVPTDIGAGTRGASMGPEALRVAGIGPVLQGHGLTVIDRGNLTGPANPWQPPVGGYRHLDEVAAWNTTLHEAVYAELAQGHLPIVLGGDHSLGLGSISAVARHCREQGKKLRVLWLDAHADFNTAALTPSGNVHGMPVACLCGHGPAALTGIGGHTPAIPPEAVRQIGIRSVDPGEKRFVHEAGLEVFDMRYIDEMGMRHAMEQALMGVDENTHLHVSFDVDFLDPEIAPGVGTTVPGGPTYREAQLCMEMIADTGRLASLDVMELNPALDVRNRTAELAVDLIESLFGKSTLMRKSTASAPRQQPSVPPACTDGPPEGARSTRVTTRRTVQGDAMRLPSSRLRHWFGLWLALWLTFAWGLLHAQPRPSLALDNLATRAATQGYARVLIGLKADTTTPDIPGLARPSDTERHRRVASAQDKFEANMVRGSNSRVLTRFQHQPHVAAEVDANTLARLRASPDIVSIEEDVPVRRTLLESTALIGATAAWASGVTGAGQAVAVLDTGVDKTHPMLSGKVVSEACYSSNTSWSSSLCPGGVTASTATGSGLNCAASFSSGCSHGTHVAGIVAGNAGTAGTYGVARGAQIIAIQVFSYFPADADVMSWTSDQIKALERVYALKDTYKIASVNMSLGGGQYTATCDASNLALKAAIDNLRTAGIATVIASGNNGWTNAISAPACISSAISVGAHCDAGPDASYCATGVGGVAAYSNIASFVSLVAPGSYIRSSVPGSNYASYNGTSMATPHVAGAWALLKQANPSISVSDGLALLRQNAVTLNDTRSGGSVTGLKRLQVGFLASTQRTLTVTRTGTGSGTVASAPAGISCGSDCSEVYADGTSVTLTATASTGSTFSGWSGACSGTGSCTVSMTEARLVSAQFQLPTFSLSVTRAGSGSGTVTSSPSGISCGATCSASIASGATVTLTATPATGSRFAGWSGACTGTGTCTVSMTAARSVTATFEPSSYTLSVTRSGQGAGSVTSSPAGISCGATCSASIAAGATVTLTATPATGSRFAGWSGACTGTGTCTVSMAAAKSVGAQFDLISYALTYSRAGTSAGSVTIVNTGTVCDSACSATFSYGTVVQLTAAPASGSRFIGWSGACTGTGTCSVSMAVARSVIATFEPSHYALNVTRSGQGAGSVTSSPAGISCGATCSASIAAGTSVTLTAAPATGSRFAGWSGACTGTGTCTVSMAAVKSVGAQFDLLPYALTYSRTGAGTGTMKVENTGTVCTTAACSATFLYGTEVQLTATPATGSSFAGWSGACTGTGTCTVSMAAAKSVVAKFDLIPYALTYSRTGAGTGTMKIVNTGTVCTTATCSPTFLYGTTVQLTATPAAGSRFTGWSGACTGTSTCSVSMAAVKSVVAQFDLIPYALTYSRAGAGTGTMKVENTGTVCTTAACSATFPYGTEVQLTATPATGSSFAGWSGACTGTGTCTVSMAAAKSAVAKFDLIPYALSYSRTGTGSGSVKIGSTGTVCAAATCNPTFPYGTAVQLTATPAAGSRFTGWSGACTGTGTCSVSMAEARNVTATFEPSHYTLGVTRSGQGAGSVTSSPAGISCGATCSASIASGATVTLTATPAAGSSFAGWSGACTGTGTCTVSMGSNQSVGAVFAKP